MSIPSRRAGSSLVTLFSSPSSRAATQPSRRRTAQQYWQRRPISYNPSQRQGQQTQAQTRSQPQSQSQPQPQSKPQQTPSSTASPSQSQRPSTSSTPAPQQAPQQVHTPQSLTEGLQDAPKSLDTEDETVDWTRSYHGLSSNPFTPEAAQILQQEIPFDDVEVKPDGILYLPEIKYRRILNRAFGPGGWGLAPRGETIVTGQVVTREYSLVCGGRLVSIARGEQQYFSPDGIPTATEGCKSNALMRCCKDLGVASELWDPRYIRKFMKEHVKEMWVEHVTTKKKRKHFMRKDDDTEIRYPYQQVPSQTSQARR
ncbi:hypothetical protein MBLNU230_g4223t1 [Neophaeotheca triangularis]